jgi:hypothetical protein
MDCLIIPSLVLRVLHSKSFETYNLTLAPSPPTILPCNPFEAAFFRTRDLHTLLVCNYKPFIVTTDHAGTVNIFINERNARGDIPLLCIKPRFAESYIVPFNCSSQICVVVLARSRNLQFLIAHFRIRHVHIYMYAITSV